MRSALGVSRAALFRQVSIESVALALVGGVAGVGLAFGIVRLFKVIGGHAIPRLDAVTTGWPLLASGLALAIVAALVAGLVPALRASRPDLNDVLKSSGARGSVGRGERRMLQAVTMIQTALTLALLVGAGLLIRTHAQRREREERILDGPHPDDDGHCRSRAIGRTFMHERSSACRACPACNRPPSRGARR